MFGHPHQIILRFAEQVLVAVIVVTGVALLREVPISPISARGIGRVQLRLYLGGDLPIDQTIRYCLIRAPELPGHLADPDSPEIRWVEFPLPAQKATDHAVFSFSSIDTVFGKRQHRSWYDDSVLVEYHSADGTLSYWSVPIPVNNGDGPFVVYIPAEPPVR